MWNKQWNVWKKKINCLITSGRFDEALLTVDTMRKRDKWERAIAFRALIFAKSGRKTEMINELKTVFNTSDWVEVLDFPNDFQVFMDDPDFIKITPPDVLERMKAAIKREEK